jgi:hypothetical protein
MPFELIHKIPTIKQKFVHHVVIFYELHLLRAQKRVTNLLKMGVCVHVCSGGIRSFWNDRAACSTNTS